MFFSRPLGGWHRCAPHGRHGEPKPYFWMFCSFFYGRMAGSSPHLGELPGIVAVEENPVPSRRTAIMHRITLAGSFSLVVLPLWLAAPVLAQAQDRAGAMMAAYQAPHPTPPPAAGQPAPPPAGQPVPPPVPPPAGAAMPPPVIEGGGGGVVSAGVIPAGGGGASGGGSVGVVGLLAIGALAVTLPPPMGYSAPV